MIGTLKKMKLVKCLIRHHNWEHDSHESILKHKFKKNWEQIKLSNFHFLLCKHWFLVSGLQYPISLLMDPINLQVITG